MKSSGTSLIFFFLLGIGVTSGQNPNFATLPGAFVDVDGGRLYYEECGTAPDAVFLLHDGVVNSAVCDEVWLAFCKRFHTIRYDRRGYGRSPATTKPYYEADDLAALLRPEDRPCSPRRQLARRRGRTQLRASLYRVR